MATDLRTYSKLLAEQLRINGMKEGQVSEVVAQVQAHTSDTREDPVEAFGQPADYARQWVVLQPGRRIRRILGAVLGVTSILALVTGVMAPGPWTGDVEIEAFHVVTWVAWIATMAVMPWTFDLWLARRRAHKVGAVGGVQDWAFRLMGIAFLMVAFWVVFTLLGERELDAVAFTMPKWAFVAVGSACLPGLAFIGTGQRRALPEAPGHVPWRTKVRRAFINR